MPWKEASMISLRKEFVELARNGSNISRLCESFGISRQAGYKWIRRYNNYLWGGSHVVFDKIGWKVVLFSPFLQIDDLHHILSILK
jgi:Helix-turn-helix domain